MLMARRGHKERRAYTGDDTALWFSTVDEIIRRDGTTGPFPPVLKARMPEDLRDGGEVDVGQHRSTEQQETGRGSRSPTGRGTDSSSVAGGGRGAIIGVYIPSNQDIENYR